MKRLWKAKGFKLFRKGLKWTAFVYLLVVIVRSYNTYTLTNSEFRDENRADVKRNYYLTFRHVKEKAAIQLDANNVYFVDYSQIKSLGVSNQKVYSPVTLALNALRSYQKFIRKDDRQEKTIFLANANWLVEHITPRGEWLLTQDVAVGQYMVKAPWCSGLSQGLGISVLCRAYEMTGDERYIETARQALQPYHRDISLGGVRTTNDFGTFYEEYPLLESPTHVFNGHMYSLFGLYDLFLFDNNEEARLLFKDGVDGLVKALPQYDLDHWTKYSLNTQSNLKNHWNYCSPWYQKLHTNQLSALHHITGEQVFGSYAQKFAQQRDRSWVNLIIYPAYTVYTDFVWVVRKVS